MRIVAFKKSGEARLGVRVEGGVVDLAAVNRKLPRDLKTLLHGGKAAMAAVEAAVAKAKPAAIVKEKRIKYLPPIADMEKIICVGLNYIDHVAESPYKNVPTYPVLFNRFANSLLGHGEPIRRPKVSTQLDYEGELAVIIGKSGRYIAKEKALAHVAGYSVFNDGSIRDYQFKATQWLMGKNFDATGPFGPDFVTADELPPGAKGLQLTTRLNGEVMQSANTNDMIFDVATLVHEISQGLTLEPGDVIVSGTPSGVGFARKPQVWMKPGDVCEVEIEKVGLLRSPIAEE